MSEIFIKNMEHEKALNLAEQVKVMPGQVVSKTLAQNKAVSVTLFAFDKGEEISTHDSDGDAMLAFRLCQLVAEKEKRAERAENADDHGKERFLKEHFSDDCTAQRTKASQESVNRLRYPYILDQPAAFLFQTSKLSQRRLLSEP